MSGEVALWCAGVTERRRALDAGFDNHVTKPVDPESLRQLLAARVPAADA